MSSDEETRKLLMHQLENAYNDQEKISNNLSNGIGTLTAIVGILFTIQSTMVVAIIENIKIIGVLEVEIILFFLLSLSFYGISIY
jgi:predicted membrane channel-forming protein YqfA (hemolysin III family)